MMKKKEEDFEQTIFPRKFIFPALNSTKFRLRVCDAAPPKSDIFT